MNEIRFIKLRSGDEIISEIESVEGKYVLSNPVQLVMGQGGVRFIPYPVVGKADEHIQLYIDDVIFSIGVNEDCESAYRQTFGGIVSPPSTLVLPN